MGGASCMRGALGVGSIHRDRRYVKASTLIRSLANGTPTAVCWRCGRTLAEHPPHKNGRAASWHTGHTVDGSTSWQVWAHVSRVPTPGDWLAPEASTCNTSDGAAYGNRRREPSSGWLTT